MARKMDLTQDALHELFEYRDGQLFRKSSGKIAGTTRKDGRKQMRLNGRNYFVHRLIYQLCHGDINENLEIDHIDGDHSNNHIVNLRQVTATQNMWNMTRAKGYRKGKTPGKFEAYMGKHYKVFHLGTYDNESDARQAYLTACQGRV